MRILSIGFFLFVNLCAAWADEPSFTPIEQAEQKISNFQSVDGAVFRGGRPDAAGVEILAELNVDTVIDLEGGDIHGHNFLFNFFNYLHEPGEHKRAISREKELVIKNGIKHFYSIPLNSNDSVSSKEAVDIDRVLSILHDHEEQPVYVHCQHGKDRTGLIVALYEVKFHHMTPEAAHDEMVSRGHSGVLDLLFTGKLDEYFWKVAPAYYSEGELPSAF